MAAEPTDRELVGWLIHTLCASQTDSIPAQVRDALLSAKRVADGDEWKLEQWLRTQPDG